MGSGARPIGGSKLAKGGWGRMHAAGTHLGRRLTRSMGSGARPIGVHTGGGAAAGGALLQNMKERREVECACMSMNRST